MKDSTMISKSSKVNGLGSKAPTTRSALAELAEPLVSVPPDGGWGWAVMVAVTFVMFCVDGLGYCFSIFFEEMMRDFHCELTDIALLSALSGGFYYLFGPLTCSIVNRFGFQVVAVFGGALLAGVYLLASFTTSLPLFLTLVGLMGGCGFNLIYTASLVSIGFYFERWRALAMAVTCCGSSLGVVVFPALMVQFFSDWSWRSVFRMVAGVFAVCAVVGLVLKPIKAVRVERTVQFGQVSQRTSMYTLSTESELRFGTGLAAVFRRFRNAFFPTISEASVLPHGSQTSSTAYSFFMPGHYEDDMGSTYLKPFSQDSIAGAPSANGGASPSNSQQEVRGTWAANCRFWCCCRASACCRRPLSFTNVNRPLYRDDIFYGGSVYRLPHYSNASGLPSLAYTLSVSRAATQRDMEQQHQCVCCPEAVLRVLTTMLHFQMLKSPAFMLLLVSGYLSLMGILIVFTYAAQFAMRKGLDPNSAKLVLSIIGISNTLGRAACGAMLYVIACALFGFNLASFTVLRALVFVELFGLENLTNCFGLNMLFQSLSAFSSTPLANVILLYTGGFQAVFLFTGSALLLSGALLIPLKPVLKWERRNMNVTFS
ncbi:hypothetical protein HUJ04_012042 [Dendroctonus ponderosae]|nr:hypothetical protein HUJ04_012042 [Dendroctonus ponderosae]